jgi:hypothetical protein
LIFDDETTRSRSYTFDAEGRLLQETFVDGDGTQGRSPWSSQTRSYNNDGALVELVVLRDDGDRKTTVYADGVMQTRVYEDLVDDRQWDTRTEIFDATGVLIDTVYT